MTTPNAEGPPMNTTASQAPDVLAMAIDALEPFARLLEQVARLNLTDKVHVDSQVAVGDMRRAHEALAALRAAQSTPAATMSHEEAREIAFRAAKAFRPSYFTDNYFEPHNWVIAAVQSAALPGQRLAAKGRDAYSSGRYTPAAVPPSVLGEPGEAFRVSVHPMQASNGLTYVVCLDRADRPVDAKPWDDGRKTPINRNDLEEANEAAQEWANFLGATFTPCEASVDTRSSVENTVPEYGLPLRNGVKRLAAPVAQSAAAPLVEPREPT